MDIFNLERELYRSRININLNEINEGGNENKFLVSKIWESLEDMKIAELDAKVESIYRNLNQESIKSLKEDIDKMSLENYYKMNEIVAGEYPIGCLNNLNFLVETTFLNEYMNNEKINSDINELTPYLFKFRSIKGDGDCFYRSLIFSFLENIIFNNKIMQMKELLIIYHEKINKNNELINQKEYLKKINELNISIVSEILYLIISQLETDISKAYLILLKAFLFCDGFDESIVYFTRYLFYEYISANEDKIISKEFQITVGSLLPDDFIIDLGEKDLYLFEDYYSSNLMKPKIYAEKMVIYVAPFIFNIRMNVLMYDFENNFEKSNIQEKKFWNENGDKNIFQAQINLLYRRNIHYDVYYKYDEYEDFKKYFDIFNNRLEEGHFLGDNNIKDNKENKENSQINKNLLYDSNDYNDNKINNNININKNNIIPKDNINEIKNNIINNEIQPNINNDNKKEIILDNNKNQHDSNNNEIHLNVSGEVNNSLNNNINQNNNSNNINNQINYNLEDKINDINLNEDQISNAILKCKECKINDIIEPNKFNLCDKCLYNNLKSIVLSAFLEFLKDRTNLVNSQDKFNHLIKQKKCKISTVDNITIEDAIINSKYKLDDILLDVRSHMCLFCAQEIETEDDCFIEFPCKCKICSDNCFRKYIEKIGRHITLSDIITVFYRHIKLLSCYCGFIYNTQNVLYMIKEMEKKGLNDAKEVYQNYILNFWNWRCYLCKNNFEIKKDYVKAVFECQNIDKNLLNLETEFKHLICDECLYKNNAFNGKNIFCKICELNHKIISLIKVNEHNEETNPINF